MAEATSNQLRLLVERIERLEEDKKRLTEDIRDVYAEAKAAGFEVKALREVVRLRRWRPADRREHDLILETYKAALGMV